MFKSALNILDDAICICDQQMKVLYMNPAAVKLIGRTLESTLKKSIKDVFGNPYLVGTIEEAVRNNARVRKDGLEIGEAKFSLSVSPLMDGDVVQGFVIALKTPEVCPDERQFESNFGEIDSGLIQIIESLPDATFVIDRDKKVIAWNKAIEEMTGVKKAAIVGKGDYVYAVPFYGKPRSMLVDLIGSEANRENESNYPFVERRGDNLYTEVFAPSLYGDKGAYLWAAASPIYDNVGRLIGSIEYLRDVTDRKVASDELVKRDILLSGVAVAANALLTVRDFDEGINQALEILGLSLDVDRVYIFENHEDPVTGEHLASRKFEWCRDNISSQMSKPLLHDRSYDRDFPRWFGTLRYGETLNGQIKDFPGSERAVLELENITSILVVPIIIDGMFWGFIGFDECRRERIWTKSEIAILKASAGSIGAFVVRKNAEVKLEESKEFLNKIINSISDPIFVKDRQHRLILVNDAACKLFGRSLGEIIGRTAYDLFRNREMADNSYKNDELVFETGVENESEETNTYAPGVTLTVIVKKTLYVDNSGNQFLVGITRDITGRKQAEEKILFQASLLSQVHNAIVATDLAGNIIYWNKYAQTIYQWRADEVIGKNISETVVPMGSIDRMHEVMDRISLTGSFEGEMLVRRKDASTFPAYYVLSLLKDGQGRNMGFLGVSVDISERKRAEEDLREAKERAESATKTKSEFLANMSHEIRTPMNAIIGMTGLLLDTELSSDQREFVEIVRCSGDSLLSLINDILDFSKIEGDKLEMESQPFNLKECVEASMDLVTEASARKGLSLSYSIDGSVPCIIVGDVTRLRQVLANLLSNAVKFTESGEVSLSVSSEEREGLNEICFSVNDTGIGIEEDQMALLFESFSQLDSSITRKYGGSGLGLAISKKLVEMMGGTIWAESTPALGSTFSFTIMAETGGCNGSITEASSETLALVTEHFPLRILLAEDNLVNQKVALRMLERIGYRADAVADGQEALKALDLHPYDVVFMDVQMPEMDGLEATRQIRLSLSTQPYIIAMTAHALKGDRERCLDSGMNDYISKPVKIEELRMALIKASKRLRAEPALDSKAIDNLRQLQMEGEPDILEELGGLFMEKAPLRIKAIKDALVKGDPEALYKEAHNLKSSSANLGAMRLSGICKELEALGRAGTLDRAMELAEKADAEFERVRTALKEEMADRGS